VRAFERPGPNYTEGMADEHGQVKESSGKRDPEREARRRLALAQIRQYPDPSLRLRASEVEAVDDELRLLVERMLGLMEDANGIGLAATQVGVLRRLFVCRLGDEDDDEEEFELHAFVNPVVTPLGDERKSADEGCLSLQEVLVPVDRPARVVIEATDLDGVPVRLELEKLDARVVQHELDHLDGILIIDRTTDEARREALATLRPRPELAGRA
jgi:peptide deformylase